MNGVSYRVNIGEEGKSEALVLGISNRLVEKEKPAKKVAAMEVGGDGRETDVLTAKWKKSLWWNK